MRSVERIKLTATFLNNVAVAIVVTGVVAPLAAFTYSVPSAAPLKVVALRGLGWIIAGILIHLYARRTLGRLPS